MTIAATWLATLGSAILANLQQFFTVNAPNILANLFAGKIPAGTGTALLSDLEAVGLSKLADLGLTEYMHTYVKSGDNFINDACAANPSQDNLFAVLSVFVTHGAVANAAQQVLLARAMLQWNVALAENADKAASTPVTVAALAAARQARDDAQTYLEGLTAQQLVELVGDSETVAPAPADLAAALVTVNGFMANPPTGSGAAPVITPPAAATPAPTAPAPSVAIVTAQASASHTVSAPAGSTLSVVVGSGAALVVQATAPKLAAAK